MRVVLLTLIILTVTYACIVAVSIYGDGIMRLMDGAEVVAVALFAVAVCMAAVSVALDNFNLWRRKR